MRISFRVAGIPVPQVRPKVRLIKKKDGKSFGSAYYPDPKGRRKAWCQSIQSFALGFRPERPIEGPVYCGVEVVLPRPKSHYRSDGRIKENAPFYHTTGQGQMGGDRDNFDKIILDSLTKVGMWQDDGQVCSGPVIKRYCLDDGWTGAIIAISSLSNERPLPLEDVSNAG